MDTIVSIARAEVTGAFSRLNITFTDRRDASYRIAVVQELRDMRFRWQASIPAESRAVTGLGGEGAVSFSWLASGAVAYAPEAASRSVLLEGIGRGIGRAAVHEFVHIMLPHAQIDDSEDRGSYEYGSAARREQYFGELHWGRAWPLLQERLEHCADGQAVGSPDDQSLHLTAAASGGFRVHAPRAAAAGELGRSADSSWRLPDTADLTSEAR